MQLSGLHTLGTSVRHTVGAPNPAQPWLAPRRWAGLVLLAILIASVILAGSVATTVMVVLATCYLVISTFNFSYLAVQRNLADRPYGADSDFYPVPDDQLPRYTVIVTALRKNLDISTVLRQASSQISEIDYPADKLDAYLAITEDIVTPAEVLLQNNIRLIILPTSMPHTNADVCNYVINSPAALGEYLTVYRIGDMPDRLQLRQAIRVFASAPTNVIALQAKLRCVNVGANLVTRLRAVEYERWFSNRAPILSRLGCVVPLANSSHHIRTSLLREAGGWDPTSRSANVELSIRLARNGYRILILDSYTGEMPSEARIDETDSKTTPHATTWYEGYLPVLAAYAKEPIRLSRELGLTSVFRIFDVTTARPLAYLANVGLWLLLGAELASAPAAFDIALLVGTGALCLLVFLAANFLAVMARLETADPRVKLP